MNGPQTPAIGWAQSILYRSRVLREARWAGSVAVAHGGDASAATNGFWSALIFATTQRLPILFFIEDNGYGISVKSDFQTPGGNIAANLASFRDLAIFQGDSSDPLGVKQFATHHMPLEDAPHGYKIFQSKADGCIKVVLQP